MTEAAKAGADATSAQDEPKARRFLKRAALTACCAALAAPAINAFVDPLNLFPQSDIRTRFGCAPGFRIIDADSVPVSARDSQPQVLLAGTSRTLAGHEADDPVLAAFGGSTFNLGVSGASMARISRVVEYATAEYAPRVLIVGLSFGSFLRDAGSVDTTAALRLRAWLSNLFSPAATRQSFGSLTNRTRCREPVRGPSGYAPLLLKEAVARSGRESMARAVDMSFAQTYTAAARKMRLERRISALDDAQTDALSALLARHCSRGTRLLIFFEPAHARLLEVTWETGLWNDYERVKRLVTGKVTQLRQAGCAVELWDFSGHNRYTTESFADPEIRFFWESSHYTSALGRVITQYLFSAEKMDGELGSRLTEDTVDAHLARLRTRREEFIGQNPALHEYVKGIMRSLPAK